MRGGDENLLDEVVLGGHRARLPLPAALLRAVEGNRVALDVAGVADRHDHVLVGDQVLVGQVARLAHDLGSTCVGEVLLHLAQLVLDHLEQQLFAAEDGGQAGDELLHFVQLVDDLLLLQAGEALQLHLENRLRLQLGESVERLQLRRGDLAVRARLDHRDHLVDVVERDLVTEEDVLALARLSQVVARAADVCLRELHVRPS